MMSFVLQGCSVDSVSPPAASSPRVSGVAASGAPIAGVVSLKDSSVPAQVREGRSFTNGYFSINVSGLKPPFLLKVEKEGGTADTLYSLSAQQGRTNINPFSHATADAAFDEDGAEGDSRDHYDNPDPDRYHRASDRHGDIIEKLREVLEPLFLLYQTSQNPVSDDFEADHTGLDALFDDVRIKFVSRMVVVTNKYTGGVIFTGPVRNLASGTFYPENMPGVPGQVNGASLYAGNCSSCHGALADSSKKGATAAAIQAAIAANTGNMGSLSKLTALDIQAIATALAVTTPPTTIDGAALYASKCSSCHGALATSGKQGATATAIQSAINNNQGGMGSLSALTADQVAAIAAALATTTPPPPAACTYTYDVWGACQPSGTQIRGLLSSSPAGCTGTPVLTRSCTYVPPVTACTSFTYSAWGTCQSNNTQTRTQLTASPAGCTGGTPVLSQACTYVPPVTTCTSFTYSAWGACQSDSTQTRTQLTASPAGCTGGTPVLSQACTYVPPVTACTSFTYSAWGACQSDSTQTRTQLTASPAGCTGGTPVLSQSCTYVPPTPACGSCHSIPPATGKHAFHSTRATCATCHGTGYSTTTVNSATHANGVNNVVSNLNFNATTSTCGTPGCHGSRAW
jgi:mono/diheme cytochrome c family protein